MADEPRARGRDKTSTLEVPALRAPRRAPELLVMLYHRDGLASAPLREGEPVVVGRGEPSDVVVAEPSLSRRHASFTLESGQVVVEDFGSRNGTWVEGEQIDRTELPPGATLRLGAVEAVIYQRPPGHDDSGLTGHDRFMETLGRAVTDARYFDEPTALLMLRVLDPRGEPAHVSRWAPLVADAVRRVDVVGLYGQSILEVVLVRTSAEAARRQAKTLLELDVGETGTMLCGLATFPADGGGAEALLEASRRALVEATPTHPLSLASETRDLPSPKSSDSAAAVTSEAMQGALASIERIAAANIPVLIQGETGVGKEVVARDIHARSGRAEGPFVAINCGAIPKQLVESTLFGHERGAFTGADKASPGVFGSADGGTVLLDEIGELPLAAQTALLRTLETGSITRVGSAQEQRVNVRVVAATHRDLDAMVRQGSFRQDLLYRINALVLAIPPLRQRRSEIPALVKHFLANASRVAGEHSVRSISPAAMDRLRHYAWPGNVRELRNVIERGCVIARGDQIGVEDLPERVRGGAGPRKRPSDEGPASAQQAAPPTDFRTRVHAFERGLLVDALRATGGNKAAASRKLGIPLRTLTHKIKTLSIANDEYES